MIEPDDQADNLDRLWADADERQKLLLSEAAYRLCNHPSCEAMQRLMRTGGTIAVRDCGDGVLELVIASVDRDERYSLIVGGG